MFAADSCLVVTNVRRFYGVLGFPAPIGALWTATRLIDIQLAAVELSTIQLGDRLVRIFRAGHLHEGKPARLA